MTSLLAAFLEVLLVGLVSIDRTSSGPVADPSVSEHQQFAPMSIRGEDTSSNCPTWTFYDAAHGNSCQCPHLPGDPLLCEEQIDGLVPYILDCYCATRGDGGVMEVGQCDYNCASNHDHFDVVYHQLPSNISKWNEYMCQEFKRSGTLCGKCDMEFYPRAYSFNYSCVKCEGTLLSNLWKYMLLTYLPLTIIYLAIFCLNVDIHSSQLLGFIIFSQTISIPALARNLLLTVRDRPAVLESIRFVTAFYGVWNLDFFRTYNNGVCFRISLLATLFLDLLMAVYPLMLMPLTYFTVKLYDLNFKLLVLLWKPFKLLFSRWQKHFSIKTSMVNGFAAFFFLTNAKFFSVSLDILVPVKVYQFHPSKPMNTTWRLYIDPSIEYLQSEHRWYASAAILIVFTLIITPVLLLLFYSLSIFQKCLGQFPLRLQIYLHTFVDSFQGCYKDGTQPGTGDCRWYASTLYVGRFLLVVIYGFTLNAMYLPNSAIVLTMYVIITINVDPFKPHLKHLGSSMVIFLLFIDISYVSAIGSVMADESGYTVSSYTFYTLGTIVVTLPILYISIIVLIWFVNICKCKHHLRV